MQNPSLSLAGIGLQRFFPRLVLKSSVLRAFCEFQLCALIFALPFEYHFGARDDTLFTTVKLQTLVLVATWAGLKLVEPTKCTFSPLPGIHALLAGGVATAVGCFALIELIAAAIAPEFGANAGKAGMKVAFGALLSLVAADMARGHRSKAVFYSRVLLTLTGSCTLMALVGLGHLAGVGFFTRIVYLFQSSRYLLGSHLRLFSTMEYPNTAASMLSIGICAALALILSSGSPRNRPAVRLLCFAGLALQGAALALTYSRGAVAATIVGLVVGAWVMRSQIRSSGDRIAVGSCLAILLLAGAACLWVRHREKADRDVSQSRAARYRFDNEAVTRFLLPGRKYEEVIAVQNDSSLRWYGREYGVGYRWYGLDGGRNSPLLAPTYFAHDIDPKAMLTVPIRFETPSRDGEYLLIWFVFRQNRQLEIVERSYSPGILCVVGRGQVTRLSDRARRYVGAIANERRALNNGAIPGRPELWSAALRMFRSSPIWGIGPDNFRMLKWRYMELPKGDETILANSLYLEILSGSGIMGLMAFLWLVCRVGLTVVARASRIQAGRWFCAFFGSFYLSALLTHGLVDYFLKFTPTFLLFWIMVGMLSACTGQAGGAHNADRV